MNTSDVKIDFSRLGPPSGSRMVVTGGCGGMGRLLVREALNSAPKPLNSKIGVENCIAGFNNQ